MHFKRGKRKYKTDYGRKDLYKYYKDNYPNNVDYKTYVEVISRYWDLIIPMLIEEALEIKFPSKLGHFRVRQKEYEFKLREDGEVDKSHLAVDYKKTKKYWEELYPDVLPENIKAIKDKPYIYHLNEHSDGKRYLFYWDKLISNVANQKFYKIKMIRKWKNYLSNYTKYESPIYFT